ncbi:hypothetical protein C8Q76DRAFT_802869 [Earliella scabrosa]|nr:hypothetical protein C8Q76DRAFT_802869 [Earliella scabrosa]
MQHSRLPTELCERVINLVGHSLREYSTLQACSLTCTAFLPSSRINLYQSVHLIGRDRFDLFVRTLATTPRFGSFVQDLTVVGDSKQPYLPFASPFLLQHLPNLDRLTLWIDWDQYPPRYHELVAQLPIKELRLFGTFWSARRCIPLIKTLKHLERITLDPEFRNEAPLPATETCQNLWRSRTYHKLKDVVLRFRDTTTLRDFPLVGALTFGSLSRLHLHFDRIPAPDDLRAFDTLVTFIASLPAMDTLQLTDLLNGPGRCDLTCRADILLLLLGCASVSLRHLRIHLMCYGAFETHVLFDRIFTDDVGAALKARPELQEVQLSIECTRNDKGNGKDTEKGAGYSTQDQLGAALTAWMPDVQFRAVMIYSAPRSS